ncbi:MAG: prevent-host-death protein [Chitinophagales bacterium]|nr:prevent-host-death protein [Chitinophagales bacterium]
MKTFSVGDLKANFSDVLNMVREGEEIAISYGRKKKIVARIIPEKKVNIKKKRRLGLLKGKGKVTFHGQWRITDEDFLNS